MRKNGINRFDIQYDFGNPESIFRDRVVLLFLFRLILNSKCFPNLTQSNFNFVILCRIDHLEKTGCLLI